MSNYIKLSDEELQSLAVPGDRIAEERLVERYVRLVRICARPYFLAGGDSEDLMQEGMMGLLSAIRKYNQALDASFKTFAEQCIKNRIISAIRTASRMKHTPLNEGLSLDEIHSQESSTRATHYPSVFQRSPEEQVLARERTDEFSRTYLKCLSKFEAAVLRLYLEGLSYSEMAESLGKPSKSVDNAVQRIRRKLAQHTDLGDFS